jgi:hypothetical protein
MTETNVTVPTMVFVHAAWADASSWNKVIPDPPAQRDASRGGTAPIDLAVR